MKEGQPIFKLDSTEQQAALELAKRRSAEIDAQIVMAEADIEVTAGQVQLAENALKQIADELAVKQELFDRKSGTVSTRELERLQTALTGAEGTLASARATQSAAEIKVATLLPAEKASAEASLKQAEVELAKMTVYAGVDGQLEQFVLQVGDIVNPMMRPAGILIPARRRAAPHPGRLQPDRGRRPEARNGGRGDLRGEAAADHSARRRSACRTTSPRASCAPASNSSTWRRSPSPAPCSSRLEPLFEDGLDGMTPGSNCIVNAYTSFHEELKDENLGTFQRFGMHAVDTVALVHAMILRVQALFIPIKTLVLRRSLRRMCLDVPGHAPEIMQHTFERNRNHAERAQGVSFICFVSVRLLWRPRLL